MERKKKVKIEKTERIINRSEQKRERKKKNLKT